MSQTTIMIGHLVSMLLSPSVSRVLYSTSDPEGVNYNISEKKKRVIFLKGQGLWVRSQRKVAECLWQTKAVQ